MDMYRLSPPPARSAADVDLLQMARDLDAEPFRSDPDAASLHWVCRRMYPDWERVSIEERRRVMTTVRSFIESGLSGPIADLFVVAPAESLVCPGRP